MNLVHLLALRSRVKERIRSFFGNLDYLEVETPIAVKCPGTEVYLRYFKTTWLDYAKGERTFWLRSSPELHMKQLLASGAERIYQLAPCFRNKGEHSEWHNPEFSMLEWYHTGISFDAYIDQTEALLRETLLGVRKSDPFHGSLIQLPAKMQRFTVAEAFQEFAGIALEDRDEALGAKARKKGIVSVNPDDNFETAFFKILIEKVEPGLAQFPAAVLLDYPASQAALARIEHGVAKRFEIYVGRIELCNGFYELLDPQENQRRIRETNSKRLELGHEVTDEDQDFYHALARGIPPCCGNALGFDRWVGVMVGLKKIADVMPFWHLYS